nr:MULTISPECIES: DUF1440 domain-containing protein [unclassified Schaalia]
MVKIGWEAALPPRTPARDNPNPPMHLLEQVGLSENLRQATLTYNENKVPVTALAIHHAFSVGAAIPYCFAAHRYPWITKYGGAILGTGVWVGFHLFLLPAIKTIPAAYDQPAQEHFSEALGHLVWSGTIEAVRHSLS